MGHREATVPTSPAIESIGTPGSWNSGFLESCKPDHRPRIPVSQIPSFPVGLAPAHCRPPHGAPMPPSPACRARSPDLSSPPECPAAPPVELGHRGVLEQPRAAPATPRKCVRQTFRYHTMKAPLKSPPPRDWRASRAILIHCMALFATIELYSFSPVTRSEGISKWPPKPTPNFKSK